ncbi:shikimate dehydrogenase [Aeromicrobium sp. NPDC092404]|uniref:shikimate dehydrogenase n=1 Tax=Aeromicrobium sp. NPDC092404 TaxID=3154976 RepID=UPI0034463FEF
MRCAVLGSPIAHSLSPAMHRAAYAELGLDWSYEAVELDEDGLEPFLSALGDDVRGFSVTAPLKRRTAALVGEASEVVGRLGVANTVLVEDSGLRSDNTDVPGAVAALIERGVERVTSARILGGGATAASMAYAVSTMGAERVELVVREPSRAVEAAQVARGAGLEVTVHTIDEPLIDKLDLLISTVPGEAVGSRSHELVDSSRAVFDVVYDPWPTQLAEAAEQADVRIVSGLDLLAHQAALQVELMTGSRVSPQLLRRAALAELATR